VTTFGAKSVEFFLLTGSSLFSEMDLRDACCQDGRLMQLAQDLAVMNTWYHWFYTTHIDLTSAIR